MSNDSIVLVPAEELEEDMLVDLRGDEYADPAERNLAYQYEYAHVLSVSQANPGYVDVEFDSAVITFPPRYHVRVVQVLPDLEEAVTGLRGIVEDLR